MRLNWLVVFGAVVLPLKVSAVRFSCASATTPKDKYICQSPELSALDGKLAQTYRQKFVLLSPQGASLLRNSEQSWLLYVETVCPMASMSDP